LRHGATDWTVFDPSEHLGDEIVIAEYLSACLDEGDPVFLAALADVAKARGMTQVAEAAGLGRESLYKALAPGAHPRHETIRRVIAALGLKLEVRPAAP
jgi:probable addiction module antidote protein